MKIPIILVAAAALVASADGQFTEKFNANLCLKNSFVFYRATRKFDSNACKEACAENALCQAYRLPIPEEDKQCELYIFDRCSHDMNKIDCSDRGTVWVRNQGRVSPGELCPSTFSFSHGTSKYLLQVFSDGNSSWHKGNEFCRQQPGLSKYADANDAAEAEYMHTIKRDVSAPFFIGGYMREDQVWEWLTCKEEFKTEIWGPHQPNHIDLGHHFTDIWTDHASGVDSTVSQWIGIDRALCECVDPFS